MLRIFLVAFWGLSSFLAAHPGATETSEKLAPLFRSSLDFYGELQRTPFGLYRDSYIHGRALAENKRCSAAAVGIGLIALCMEHDLNRNSKSCAEALQTLRSLNGKTRGFSPPRDPSGFFRHFFLATDGSGTSEFSTIDTAIMMTGVLFCRNTFADPELKSEADQLWNSIAWDLALARPDGQRLHMVVEDGKPKTGTVTSLFNEYYLLASLIHEYQLQHGKSGLSLEVESLPTFSVKGISLLAEPRHTPQSSFTVQFPFYLSHQGSLDPAFVKAVIAQATVDQAISSAANGDPRFWGCGAGVTPKRGYFASKYSDNPGRVVSPQIIAGFMPAFPMARSHLLELSSNPALRLKTPVGDLLPRFSLDHPEWKPDQIESIDFASMLFGLAAIHPNLGMEFFQKGTAFTFAKSP